MNASINERLQREAATTSVGAVWALNHCPRCCGEKAATAMLCPGCTYDSGAPRTLRSELEAPLPPGLAEAQGLRGLAELERGLSSIRCQCGGHKSSQVKLCAECSGKGEPLSDKFKTALAALHQRMSDERGSLYDAMWLARQKKMATVAQLDQIKAEEALTRRAYRIASDSVECDADRREMARVSADLDGMLAWRAATHRAQGSLYGGAMVKWIAIGAAVIVVALLAMCSGS